MKLFGSIGELVSLVFRLAGGKEVKVTSAAQTGGSVTPAVPVEIEIPDVGAGGSDVFVTEGAVQTLTNKTIDANGTGNSITNLEEADFQTKLADANKVLTRNASGAVTSAAITNANVDAAAAIAESKLALSYSTSSLNSALDTKLDDFASTNDSRVVLTSGTSGNAVKESAVVINGLGQMSGVARLDVDNVRVDGNTVSATSGNLTVTADGDVILDAAGDAILIDNAGSVQIRDGVPLTLYDNDNSNYIQITQPSTIGTNRTPQIPDDSGNFVLTSATQTLTNKTISGADNTLSNVNLASQVTGTLPVANGGTGQTTATAAFDALAPTTTKGDVIAHNGTDNVRVAVGTDGQVLTADSGQASGLTWTSPLTNPMDGQGQLIYGGVAGAATKLAAGSSGQLLVSGGAGAPSWSDSLSGKTFTGAVLISDGSASAPSVAFSSDADGSGTGIYRSASNTLAFSANGINVGEISAAGVWRFGPTAGVANTMQFTSNNVLIGGDDLHAGGSYLTIGRRSSGTKFAYLVAGGGNECGLSFNARNSGGSAFQTGQYDSNGNWTIGNSSSNEHNITGVENGAGTTLVTYLRIKINGTLRKIAIYNNT